jgi:hypothetical protein
MLRLKGLEGMIAEVKEEVSIRYSVTLMHTEESTKKTLFLGRTYLSKPLKPVRQEQQKLVVRTEDIGSALLFYCPSNVDRERLMIAFEFTYS